MFEEPEDASDHQRTDPLVSARDKFDQFRMHAELAAVFEGCRKFDAQLKPKLDPALARDIQRAIGTLEKAKVPDLPVIAPPADADAAELLIMPTRRSLSTNDYHVANRPGETMIVRWIEGEQVDSFYDRFQAHFNAALHQFRTEERQSLGWKQEEKTLKYLEALDAIDVKMSDRYLREPVRQHGLFVLSTQAADEMDIVHLCDYLMGVEPVELVGAASAPPEEPTEQDRAWFFKLFSLRGVVEGTERMCFFTFTQKADDSSGW